MSMFLAIITSSMFLAIISSLLQWKKHSSKAMRRQRGEDLVVAPEISLDLMIEILTRLHVESLMRFKCVSKLWFSLIRSRYFSNLYLKVASPPRLYMSLMEHLKCDSMEVCHNPGNSVLLSFSLPSSNNAESHDQDLTMPGIGGHSMVVLRGLILYIVCRKACIYNPTTIQNVTLPTVKSNIFAQKGFEKFVNYFLGHDPILDQYKVVCVVAIYTKDPNTFLEAEYWVLVLEARASWKRIEFNQPHVPTKLGLCINGVIYYFAAACSSRGIAVSYVVSFDVRSEEFSMIQAPNDVTEFVKSVGFIEYGGRPAILDHTDLVQKGLVDLWVVEDGGKWSKKSLVLQHCQMHLVYNNISFKVQGTTRNGEVILAPIDLLSTCYILYYDLRNNDLRKINIRDIWDQTHGFSEFYSNWTLMDKSESIMHLET